MASRCSDASRGENPRSIEVRTAKHDAETCTAASPMPADPALPSAPAGAARRGSSQDFDHGTLRARAGEATSKRSFSRVRASIASRFRPTCASVCLDFEFIIPLTFFKLFLRTLRHF